MDEPQPSFDQVALAHGNVQRLRVGRGRPLLYLHGVAGEVVALPLFAQLASRYEVHVPAHPGFGGTPECAEVRDVEDLVYHYLDYFDAVGWRAVDVVGSCLGGWIAAELASRHPERVASLTLVGAAGLHVPGAPIAELFGLDAEATCALLFERRDEVVARYLAIAPALEAIGMAPKAPVPLYANQAAAARFGWNPYFHSRKLGPRLRRISAPTLVVWGERDRFVPVAHARAFHGAIRGSRLELVAGSGHLPHVEEPAAFARLLHAHLEGARS